MEHHVATRVGHHPTRIWLYRTDVSQCNDPTDICFSVPPFSCAVMKRRRQVRRVVIRHTCPSSQPPLFSPNKSARGQVVGTSGQGNCKTFSQYWSQNSIHYHLARLVICPKALSVPIGAILSLGTHFSQIHSPGEVPLKTKIFGHLINGWKLFKPKFFGWVWVSVTHHPYWLQHIGTGLGTSGRSVI